MAKGHTHEESRKKGRKRSKASAEADPNLCSRCACPKCSTNVAIDGRSVERDALNQIEREWLDRGIIV